MRLNGLLYEGHRDNHYKQILLEIRKDKYYLLYKSGSSFSEIDITQKADKFCEGLSRMNITEWNQKYYECSLESLPSYYKWKLSISMDDIVVVCSGSSDFPSNWNEFAVLFREIGIRL